MTKGMKLVEDIGNLLQVGCGGCWFVHFCVESISAFCLPLG